MTVGGPSRAFRKLKISEGRKLIRGSEKVCF